MTRSTDWAIPPAPQLGRNHDELVDEEIAQNMGEQPEEEEAEEEEEEQLVEVNLDTGTVVCIETPPVPLFFRILGTIGAWFTTFADQGKPPESFPDAIEKYTRKLALLQAGFWVSLIVGCTIGELMLPYLGLLLFSAYVIYFMLINVKGTLIAIDRLRQMVTYQASMEDGNMQMNMQAMMGGMPKMMGGMPKMGSGGSGDNKNSTEFGNYL